MISVVYGQDGLASDAARHRAHLRGTRAELNQGAGRSRYDWQRNTGTTLGAGLYRGSLGKMWEMLGECVGNLDVRGSRVNIGDARLFLAYRRLAGTRGVYSVA